MPLFPTKLEKYSDSLPKHDPPFKTKSPCFNFTYLEKSFGNPSLKEKLEF